MNATMIVCALAAAAVCGGVSASAAVPPAKVDVYYFGNSFTGNTSPALHEKLGASAGKRWSNIANLGPGWPLWHHLYHLRQGTKGGMSLTNGEWTLNPEFKPANWQANTFSRKKWDAIMLQPFSSLLKYGPVTNAWSNKVIFDEPTDIGDIASARDIIKIYLDTNNKDGSVFIFQSWPGNPLPSIAGSNGKELNHQQMEPIRRSYNFQRHWMQSYDPSVMQWEGGGAHTRDYEFQLMAALSEAFPDLWKAGRLRSMPVPDVWSLLDHRIRAGKIKGLANLGEFYTDGGHIRAGLPAYLCAATFYAVTFKSRPHDLDYTIYNDPANYGPDLFNDLGQRLQITPELAKTVHDAIWDVVQAHPYTGLGGSREKLERLESAEKHSEPVRILEIASAPDALPSKSQCAMFFWQGDVDRLAGKGSAWDAHSSGHFTMTRYATEMREKGGHKRIVSQLTDKNWKTCRLDKLILNPFGDAAAEAESTAWLAGKFLETHPTGEVLLSFSWPELPAASALRKELKLETWQPLTKEQLAPLWKSFDYTAAWAADKPAEGNAACMKIVTTKVTAQLGAKQAKRLRAFSAGALLAALDTKLKQGALPGVASVSEFYKDGTMLRTGLPRYALAALRHAVIHQSHPKALDAALFDQPKVYPPDDMDPKTPKGQLKMLVLDDEFDNGPHFPITPAGKKLVDDTVADLLNFRK